MAIREGRWDCPSCGCVGQLGRDTRCTQCGDRRPEGVRFYLPEDAPEITDAAHLAQARAGADWVCEHCSGSARATDTHCPGCGAPRGSSPAQRVRDYTNEEIPRSGDDEPEPAAPQALARPARPGKRGRGRLKYVVAAILAFFGWTQWPRQVEATVDGREWTRTVQVEENRRVVESDWALPQGGDLIRSYRDVRSYNRVLDHYETRTREVSDRVQVGTRTYTCGSRDLGNGSFEDITCTEPEYETRYRTETYQEPIYRQEPVYATKYEYHIWRWQPDTLLTARDTGEAMAWPRMRMGERQREGEKTAKYTVTFRDRKDRTYAVEVDSARFTGLRPGSPALLRVRGGKAKLLETDAEKQEQPSS